MKVIVKIPKLVNKKDCFVASEIIKYNMDGCISSVNVDRLNNDMDHIEFGCFNTFIGMIPKEWLHKIGE